MQNLLRKHAEKFRFGLVGVANTAIDFGILFGLVFFGVDKIAANFFSTGIAFIFSFFVNRSFTFKSVDGNTKRQFAYFLIITLSGLWLIQPLIINGISALLTHTKLSSVVILLTGKLLATVATLIWNYVLYKKHVFTESI